jgi:hypothetical protein
MLENRFAEHRRFESANEAAPARGRIGHEPTRGGDRVTVTLPSAGRLVLALGLIAVVFVVAFAAGRRHRPAVRNPGPPLPRAVQTPPPRATVTTSPAPPPPPALKQLGPHLPVVRAARVRRAA